MSTSTQSNTVVDQNTAASSQAVDTTSSSSTGAKISLTSAGAITTAFLEVMKTYSTLMNYIYELLQDQIHNQAQSVLNSFNQASDAANEQRIATYLQAGTAFATAAVSAAQAAYQWKGNSALKTDLQTAQTQKDELTTLRDHFNRAGGADAHVEGGADIGMENLGGLPNPLDQETATTIADHLKAHRFDQVDSNNDAEVTQARIQQAKNTLTPDERQDVLNQLETQIASKDDTMRDLRNQIGRNEDNFKNMATLIQGLVNGGLNMLEGNYQAKSKIDEATSRMTDAVKGMQDQSISQWMSQLSSYADKQSSTASALQTALMTSSRA